MVGQRKIVKAGRCKDSGRKSGLRKGGKVGNKQKDKVHKTKLFTTLPAIMGKTCIKNEFWKSQSLDSI
jgi:hypothetical protein